MTEPKSKDGRPRISPTLRRAVAVDTIGCFVDDQRLGEADLAAVKKILAERADPGFEVNRKRALAALARSDHSPEAGELLGQVLKDRKAPLRERSAAAAYLGLLPPEASEKPLLAALTRSCGLLRLEIVKSLGQVGTERALKRLRALELDEEDVAARQLALAELAIAFRSGRDAAGGDEMADRLDLNWSCIEAKKLPAKAMSETCAGLRGPTYGVPLRSDFALGFTCGRARNVVLLNEKLEPGCFVARLLSERMIAALIVAQPERLLHYGVRWLMFTSPGPDGVRMAMVRPNGDPAFEGQAVADGEGLRFTMRDTGLERTPTEIAGRVTDKDMSWTIRLWQGPLRDKQRPHTLQPPALAAPR